MEIWASISELEASFEAFLERVEAGEQIVVTDGGVPIARIIPYVASVGNEAEDVDSLLTEGVLGPDEGWNG